MVTLFRDCSEEVGRVGTRLTGRNVSSVRRTGRVYSGTNISTCGVIGNVRPVYFRGTT